MAGVFISYRRDDSEGHTGRIWEGLVDSFDRGLIFLDVDSVWPGRDYVERVMNAIAEADVMLVVIGRQWLTIGDDRGSRRLDDPDDLVRREVAAALAAKDIVVIPVLVQGASIPPPEALPAELAALSRRGAQELSHTRWATDMQSLVGTLKPLVGEPAEADKTKRLRRRLALPNRALLWLALPALAAVIAAAAVLLSSGEPPVDKPPRPTPAPSTVTVNGKQYTCTRLFGIPECTSKARHIFRVNSPNFDAYIESGKLGAFDSRSIADAAYAGMSACVFLRDGDTRGEYVDFMHSQPDFEELPLASFLPPFREATNSLCPELGSPSQATGES